MKFITYNEDFEIQLIHNMPFDELNGLGKSEEELLKEGALVEEIPEVEVPSDKLVIYKYNKEDNTVYTELVERPLTLEEKLQKQVEVLTIENQTQDELINIAMLATDEMFTMIEPLLADNLNMKGGGKMVDMYAAMVIRGIKRIEDVPQRYREQVRQIIEQ